MIIFAGKHFDKKKKRWYHVFLYGQTSFSLSWYYLVYAMKENCERIYIIYKISQYIEYFSLYLETS